MIAIILVMASLIIKLSPVGRYHAAEHMAATAYEKNPNLTLEQVSKQPRIHNDCGTNLIITVLIIFYYFTWYLVVEYGDFCYLGVLDTK